MGQAARYCTHVYVSPSNHMHQILWWHWGLNPGTWASQASVLPPTVPSAARDLFFSSQDLLIWAGVGPRFVCSFSILPVTICCGSWQWNG